MGPASGNTIDDNTISGNTNGIFIASTVGENKIRQNVVVGNPAIQSGNTRPAVQAVDILNLSPTGRTIFERNVCITSVNAPCAAARPQP